MRARSPALLLTLIACAAEPPPAADVSFEPARIAGIERLDGRGAYVAGAIERFAIRVDGTLTDSVEWRASGGTLQPAGDEVVWTLPDARNAYLIVSAGQLHATFAFDIVAEPQTAFAVNMAAQGEIDATPDGTSWCQLAIDGSDVPHVIYRNEEHRQLWYAKYTGGAWQKSLVDGPGFDIGVLSDDTHALAVSSNGVPHIAYRDTTTNQVRYATPNGANWTREQVSNMYPDAVSQDLAIRLDPANSGRPTIAWTYRPGTPEGPTVAFRASAGNWTEDYYLASSTNDYFLGGMAFAPNGTLYLAFDSSYLGVVEWRPGQGFSNVVRSNPPVTGSFPSMLTLDSANRPIVITSERTLHFTGGDPISTAYDYGGATRFDIAYFGGQPRIAQIGGTDLELLQLNPEGYWLYQRVDSASNAAISLAVDNSGNSHVCYTKSGSVWFY